MAMLVELVLKLLYCRPTSSTKAVESYKSNTHQVRLMSVLVELIMNLVYCKPRRSTTADTTRTRQLEQNTSRRKNRTPADNNRTLKQWHAGSCFKTYLVGWEGAHVVDDEDVLSKARKLLRARPDEHVVHEHNTPEDQPSQPQQNHQKQRNQMQAGSIALALFAGNAPPL
jgi:hypothetical protein